MSYTTTIAVTINDVLGRCPSKLRISVLIVGSMVLITTSDVSTTRVATVISTPVVARIVLGAAGEIGLWLLISLINYGAELVPKKGCLFL